MGTRADFYIGTGKNAQWLGSIAWDGYEWTEDPECALMNATTEEQFIGCVADIAENRKDWTSPKMGWPWPWNDSGTTDFAYYFKDGKTGFTTFSYPDDGWPDMSDQKNVTFGERSGLIVLTVKQ